MKGDRVLIDTSVWIDYLKGNSNSVAELTDNTLRNAEVCMPCVVMAELIQGAKSDKEIFAIEEFINAFTIINQSENTWLNAGKLSYKMKKKGITVNLVDCYISFLAIENKCKILTLDKHFKEIRRFLEIELV